MPIRTLIAVDTGNGFEPLRKSSDNPKSIQDVINDGEMAHKKDARYKVLQIQTNTKGEIQKILGMIIPNSKLNGEYKYDGGTDMIVRQPEYKTGTGKKRN